MLLIFGVTKQWRISHAIFGFAPQQNHAPHRDGRSQPASHTRARTPQPVVRPGDRPHTRSQHNPRPSPRMHAGEAAGVLVKNQTPRRTQTSVHQSSGLAWLTATCATRSCLDPPHPATPVSIRPMRACVRSPALGMSLSL